MKILRKCKKFLDQLGFWWFFLLICCFPVCLAMSSLDPPPWTWETAQITVDHVTDYRALSARSNTGFNGYSSRSPKGRIITATDSQRYWAEGQASWAQKYASYTITFFENGDFREIRGASDGVNVYVDAAETRSLWTLDLIFHGVLLLALLGLIFLMIREFRKALERVKLAEYLESADSQGYEQEGRIE